MKTKVFSFILTVFVLGIFSSCEGPMGPMGPEGPGVGSWDVFDLEVINGHWVRDKEAGVFYYVFEDSRITPFIADKGLVHVELFDSGAYYPLPLTEYFYDGGYLAETINFSYGAGWIRFTIGANDLFDEAQEGFQPPSHLFKVTLLW